MADPITLFDETLDIHFSGQYHVSIQLSLDGFSFCVLNTTTDKYIGYRHYTIQPNMLPDKYLERVEEILEKDDFLQHPFKSVYALFVNRKVSLVPADFFQAQKIRDFYEENHRLEPLDELHYRTIGASSIMSIFAIDNQVANLLIKYLKRVRFYHQALPGIENGLAASKNTSKDLLLVDVHYRFFDLAWFQQGRLKIYNSFYFKELEDILYYCLQLVQENKLDTGKTILNVSGAVEQGKFEKLFSPYLKDIEFKQGCPRFVYSYRLKEIPAHQLANLYTLYSCGS